MADEKGIHADTGNVQQHEDKTDIQELRHHSIHQSEVLVDKELMHDAFEGENREHVRKLMGKSLSISEKSANPLAHCF